MRAGRAVVPVDDDDGVEDSDDIHHERENQVFGDERDNHGGRRQDLGDQKQEDDQGKQNGNAKGHLLTLIGRQVEDEDAEETDEDCGYDEIDCVEESLAADL